MPPRKQQLEDGVFKGLDLSKLTRKGELTSKLNELHRALRDLSQDPAERPRELKQVAAQLVSTKILENSDKDIRLLCACCMLDLFRVFAPDAPFQDSETVRIFEMISSLLYGLSTLDVTSAAGSGSKLNYILNSLAVIKSCVVPVILAQNGVKGADEVVSSMIHALVSSIRGENSEEVLSLVGDILVACIDESDDHLDQRLMDIIFQPLTPAAKLDNPTAYKVLCVVIRKVAPKLQKPVTAFLNHVLVGTVGTSQVDDSELTDHIYPLIYELHRLFPSFLDRVIPNICTQLKTEDEEIRKNAVRLLGKLFASNSADYAKDFERNFKEFLERFNDLSASIRLDMVDSAIEIIRSKSSSDVRRRVEDNLVKKLRDPDSDVRFKVLNDLLEFGFESPLELSSATYKEMSQRLIDKDPKKDFRRVVLHGFSRIYRKYISNAAPLVEDLVRKFPGRISSVSGESISLHEQCFGVEWSSRFDFVPGMVVKCMGYQDMPTRHALLHAFQEYILPKSASSQSTAAGGGEAADEGNDSAAMDTDLATSSVSSANVDSKRSAALLIAYDSFDEMERQNFSVMIEFKRKIRNELQNYLDTIFAVKKSISMSSQSSLFQDHSNSSSKANGGGGAGAEADNEANIRKSRNRLYAFFSSDKKTTGLLEKLEQMKDKTIFKLFRKCIDNGALTSECLSARDDLLQRLGSKTPLSELVGQMFDVSGYLIVNSEISRSLCKTAVNLARPLSSANRSKASASSKNNKELSSSSDDIYSGGGGNGMISELLLKLVKSFTYSFLTSTSHLSELIKIGNENIASSKKASNFPLGKAVEIVDLLASSACSAIKLNSNILSSSNISSNSQSHANGDSAAVAEYSVIDDFYSNLLTLAFEEIESPDDCFRICTAVNRHFAQRSDSKFPVLSRIVQEIVSEERLSANNDRLANDLAILCGLCSLPMPNAGTIATGDAISASLLIHSFTGDYSILRGKLIRFVKDKLCSSKYWEKERVSFQSGSDVASAKSISWGVNAWSAIVTSEIDFLSKNKGIKPLSIQESSSAASSSSSSSSSSAKAAVASKRKSSGGSSSSAIDADLLVQSWIFSHKEELKPSLKDLHDCLFKGVELKGATIGSVDIENASCRDIVFEACATMLFHHIYVTEISQAFKVQQWKNLAWSLLTPNLSIRKRLVDFYCMIIQFFPVQLRFLAYTCLLGSDETLKQKVESSLSFAINRSRGTYNDVCKKLAMLDPSDSQVESWQKYVNERAPEVTLAYTLYLLSYHPELPESASLVAEEDQKRVQNVAFNIRLILKVLLSTMETGAENLSYLLKQTNLIAHRYVDKNDEENIGLQFVARIAVKLLNEKIDTPENVQNYPGEIFMPPSLYGEKRSKHARGGGGGRRVEASVDTADDQMVEDEAEDEDMYPSHQIGGLEEADQAIDKVLSKIKGAGGKVIAGQKKTFSRPAATGGGVGGGAAAATTTGDDDDNGDGNGNGNGNGHSNGEKMVRGSSPKLKKVQASSKSPKKPAKIVPEPSRRSNRAVTSANYAELDSDEDAKIDDDEDEDEDNSRMKVAKSKPASKAPTASSNASSNNKISSLQRLPSPAKKPPAISTAVSRASIGSSSSIQVSSSSKALPQQGNGLAKSSKKLPVGTESSGDEDEDEENQEQEEESDSPPPVRRSSKGGSATKTNTNSNSNSNSNSKSKSKPGSTTLAAGNKRTASSQSSSSQESQNEKNSKQQPKINQFLTSKKAKK